MNIGLVFSKKITKSGELGPEVLASMQKAEALYEGGQIDLVFSTGGNGLLMSDGSASQAQAIAKWFQARGIPSDYAGGSMETFGNVEDAMPRIVEMQPESITCISSKRHLRRISLIMRHYCRKKRIDTESLRFISSDFKEPPLSRSVIEGIMYLLTLLDPSGESKWLPAWRLIRGYRRLARRKNLFGYQ
ncbi:MAG: ElyC/SanA/YdcF family protein [Candidatus Spechtbacterales bacterium]